MQQHEGVAELKTYVLRMDTLPSKEKASLVGRVMALDAKIFHLLEPDKIRERFLGNGVDEVWIKYMETGDELIGYNCIFIHHFNFGGKPISCWGSRMGVHPEYRGENRTTTFFLSHFFQFRKSYPVRKIYGMPALIHPSSFGLTSKMIPNNYPYPKQTLSPQDEKIFDFLLEELGKKSVEGKPKFIVASMSITKTTDVEADYWQRTTAPRYQFFLKHNPDYLKGYAMVNFFEINLPLMLAVAWEHFRLKEKSKAIFIRFSQSLQLQEKTNKLRNLPIFTGLPTTVLRKLAAKLPTLRLQPQEHLLKQGDVERSMFVILQGVLVVKLQTSEGETIVNQVPSGGLVGEFGLLYGTPRNASIQSLSRSQLLRIDWRDLKDIWKQHPEVLQHMIQTLGNRRLMIWLRSSEGYSHMRHSLHVELAKKATIEQIQVGEHIPLHEKTVVLLVWGELCVCGELQTAPADIEVEAGTVLQARTNASVILWRTSLKSTNSE